jgi:beta-xylosidase
MRESDNAPTAVPTKAPTEEPSGTYTVELEKDTEAVTYVNDKDVTGIGDPYLITYNNTYYVTATVNGSLFDLYKSTDMKKWDYVRKIFATSYGKGWVRSNLWQPQLVEGSDGKFYLYYCGNNDDGRLRIGVAGCDKIDGTYVDLLDKPLLDLGYATIDPKFYVDDDGKMYLYYSRDCSENIVDGIHLSLLLHNLFRTGELLVSGHPIYRRSETLRRKSSERYRREPFRF